MRIGLDAMGGDRAPKEPVRGALFAQEILAEEDKIVLIGEESTIREHLESAEDSPAPTDRIEIRHAPDVIGMDDSPVETLRARPDSSIATMTRMHAAGEIDACISGGNTGACVAAAQMRLRRLKGVLRPGIAIVTPTYYGPVVVCDVGANVNCRPRHLYQYGIMSSVYSRYVCGVTSPRVGLLSIGQEEGKGNELVRKTSELLKNDPSVNFVGNVEGRDLFGGVCDVMVCEGFVGNVALKLMEGMAGSIIEAMLSEMLRSMPSSSEAVKEASAGIVAKYDFNEYGGAPLLGVAGICIICHGASNYRGIMNAVRVAVEFARHGVNQQITELLQDRRSVDV